MSKNKNLDKGNLLEEAVEKIETLIIQTNPSLGKSKFSIERKNIIILGGVKKEIDLFVKVDPGNSLESIFIFECKNLEKPVAANEITLFSVKINETNANKGFFIAKKFSRDAINEAKKYQRIELIKASNDFNYFEEIPIKYWGN